jgi:pyruvate formate lyase activating enzyme
MDVADAFHARAIQTVAVTARNGYPHDQPRRDFFAKIDAANVDLKAFTDDFYFKLADAHLQPLGGVSFPIADIELRKVKPFMPAKP